MLSGLRDAVRGFMLAIMTRTGMMSEVIAHQHWFEEDASVFVDRRPLTDDTQVWVTELDPETGDLMRNEPDGFTYLVIIEQVLTAIDVYDRWHPERAGDRQNHLRAIEHYATNGAWLHDSAPGD